MTQEPWLELPEQVVAKIEEVLGVPASKLADYGLVKLIEDLCDTALMFDREEGQTADQGAQAAQAAQATPATPATQATQGAQGAQGAEGAEGEQLQRLPPLRPDSGAVLP